MSATHSALILVVNVLYGFRQQESIINTDAIAWTLSSDFTDRALYPTFVRSTGQRPASNIAHDLYFDHVYADNGHKYLLRCI
jgi:hypothetical protein